VSQAVTASPVERRGRQIHLRPWPEQPDASGEPAGVKVELAGLSVTGPVRGRNEDRVGWAVPGDRVWVSGRAGDEHLPPAQLSGPIVVAAIADGLGGHADGDVASRFAITTLLERMAPPGALGRMADVLRGTFEEVNARLLTGDVWEGGERTRGRRAAGRNGQAGGADAGRDADSHRRRGSQTTLTAVALTATSAWIAHVGDCRVYRLRDQTLELLTPITPRRWSSCGCG
jgi:serine/threonine protein phosphatase PrpC